MSNTEPVIREIKTDVRSRRDVSLFGAFPGSGIVDFTCSIPAGEGVRRVSLVIHADGWNTGETAWYTFPLTELDDGCWTVRMTFPALLNRYGMSDRGLFYYHYAVEKDGGETIYYGGEQPEVLEKLENFVGERQLLLYRDSFRASKPLTEGIIYHIFIDRFARSGRCPIKSGAVLDPDWENGIPQYGAYPGAEVENNVFFGGDLFGAADKLDYIAALGVRTVYLSPVFDAYSNHKYDTGDYMAVDAMFGGDGALVEFCRKAEERGIRVILDGVFNHTGDNSVYFNRYGTYPSLGAYQSKDSEFYPWYTFREYPDEYECWWGVKVLPHVDSTCEAYRRFICQSVVRKWMRAGVSGWRLDVADELSDAFLDDFRKAVKQEKADAVILGEVWEDASDKVSYHRRRHYLTGTQLDSVMNYPLRQALIAYILHGDAEGLRAGTERIYRRYPKPASDMLMNFLGTHDTERILTVFGGVETGDRTNEELSVIRMTPEERRIAVCRIKLAYAILCGLPGVPCVFYGDEAGMEGYRDPFCRRPFPWHAIDRELLEHYRRCGTVRAAEPVFRDGEFRILSCTEQHVVYIRTPYETPCRAIVVAACRTGKMCLRFPGAVQSLFDHQHAECFVLHASEFAYFACPDNVVPEIV